MLRDERDRTVSSDVEKALLADAIHQSFVVRAAIIKHARRSVEILPDQFACGRMPISRLTIRDRHY